MAKKYEVILKDVLIEKKLITAKSAEKLLKEAEKSGVSFVSTLAKYGVSSEKDMLSILSEKMEIPYVELKLLDIDKAILEKTPIKLATYYKIIPIRIDNRTMTIAVSHPLDVKMLDDIRLQLGYDIKIELAQSPLKGAM